MYNFLFDKYRDVAGLARNVYADKNCLIIWKNMVGLEDGRSYPLLVILQPSKQDVSITLDGIKKEWKSSDWPSLFMWKKYFAGSRIQHMHKDFKAFADEVFTLGRLAWFNSAVATVETQQPPATRPEKKRKKNKEPEFDFKSIEPSDVSLSVSRRRIQSLLQHIPAYSSRTTYVTDGCFTVTQRKTINLHHDADPFPVTLSICFKEASEGVAFECMVRGDQDWESFPDAYFTPIVFAALLTPSKKTFPRSFVELWEEEFAEKSHLTLVHLREFADLVFESRK